MIVFCVDDSFLDRQIVKRLVGHIFSEERIPLVFQEFDCGKKLLKADLSTCDLLFMDIFLGDSNGMDLVKSIRDSVPNLPIIFVSSSADYALESYKVQAYHYLIKPLDQVSMRVVLLRFITQKIGSNKDKCYILTDRSVKNNCKTLIPYVDIIYIESFNSKLVFHLSNHVQCVCYTTSMLKLEDELQDERFFRCHQSYIINFDRVKRITDNGFIVSGGDLVPFRQRTKKEVKDAYKKYTMTHLNDISGNEVVTI